MPKLPMKKAFLFVLASVVLVAVFAADRIKRDRPEQQYAEPLRYLCEGSMKSSPQNERIASGAIEAYSRGAFDHSIQQLMKLQDEGCSSAGISGFLALNFGRKNDLDKLRDYAIEAAQGGLGMLESIGFEFEHEDHASAALTVYLVGLHLIKGEIESGSDPSSMNRTLKTNEIGEITLSRSPALTIIQQGYCLASELEASQAQDFLGLYQQITGRDAPVC